MKHGVLHDALVEVSGTQNLFHWIGLKKLTYEDVNYNIVCALYPEIPGGGVESTPPPQPILDKNSPNRIGLSNLILIYVWLPDSSIDFDQGKYFLYTYVLRFVGTSFQYVCFK